MIPGSSELRYRALGQEQKHSACQEVTKNQASVSKSVFLSLAHLN